MEPNVRLIESMEAVFVSSQARVVIAFEVLKEKEGGARYWNKASAKKARSPRVLCVTVKRSKDRGYNGTLFVCKATPSTKPYYQIRSQWELGKIGSMELPKTTDEIPSAIELNFEKEARNYIFHSEEQRLCFAAVILEVCRLHENSRPSVSGIPVETVEDWWEGNSAFVLARLGDFAQGLFATGTHAAAEAEHASPSTPLTHLCWELFFLGATSDILVSQKEERDLNALLELFVMGPGDVQVFETRLQDEHRALEEANVHAMLENGRAVDGIMNKLRSASHLLDDLDQSLLVFDMKLRHMKDDIAAIEARNNTLEMDARNSAKLLTTLQDLLSRLEMREDYEKILAKGRFGSDRLEGLIEAARALHAALAQVDPSSMSGIPETLRRMRTVKDQKLKFELLGKGFTARANEYLGTTFRQKTDLVMKQTVPSSPHSTPKLDNAGAEVHQWRQQHGALLQAMYFLQNDSLDALRQDYCTSMNAIIRKRVRAFLARLRALAKSTLSQAPQELDISRNPTLESRFSTLEQMMNKAKESVTGSHTSDRESSVQHSQRSKGKASSALDSGGSPTVTSSKMLVAGDVELGSQLHETFQTMLSSLIPMLVEEANAAASFLMLWEESEEDEKPENQRLTKEGAELIQNLVSGIEDDLFSLVDLTSKGAHLMCLPMLATVLQWIEQISSDPISWVLLGYLRSVQERLKKNFDDFMQKKVAEIDRYDMKRSVKANGVKSVHVLPFVSNFAVLVHRIELLLTEVEDVATLDRSLSLPPSRSTDLSDTDLEASAGDDAAIAVGSGSGVAGHVRKEVDLAYMRLVESMFRSIESLAKSDEKHGDRLRLENYSYFDKSVGPLARHVAALGKYCNDSIPLTNEAMRKYVQQQLEYGRLWSILAFSNKIEAKLAEVGTHEIAFQTGFSSQDVRTLLSQTMASTDKKLSMMYARVKKHLGESSPKLLYTVWQSVEKEVLDRYRKLERQMIECYPNIRLSPSPEELAELFKTTGPGT